jgi:exopolyphosphatase/guanosine-5'-triphosphate,3'-diphosphate pyrophosphatase
VLLNRGRGPIELPPLRLQLNDAQDMALEIPEQWLENHPLTDAYLEQEVEMMAKAGYELHIVKS